MAAVGAVHVCCAECDVAVPITTVITSTGVEGDKLIIGVEPELTEVITHAWAHESAAGSDRTLIQSGTDIGGQSPSP